MPKDKQKTPTPKASPYSSKVIEQLEEQGYVLEEELPAPRGFGKFFGTTLLGLTTASLLVGGAYAFYLTQVRFPQQLQVNEEESGAALLKQFQKYVNDYANEGIREMTGSPYLASELALQNGNQSRIDFIRKALSTISYKPLETDTLNKYGSPYFPFNEYGKTVKSPSLVNFGEEVEFTYLDYENLEFDVRTINDMMTDRGIKPDDEDFVAKITDLFADYMSEQKDLPTKTIKRKPYLHDTGFGMGLTSEEDVYLDTLLFSSQAFYDALDRFSLIALQGTEKESEEYKEWAARPEKERENHKEPYKWERFRFVPRNWVGFYHLTQEGDTKMDAEKYVFPSGSGTRKDPAGLNTPLTTKVFAKDKDGKDIEVPVRVTLTKVLYGSDAIKALIDADARNRGINPKSPVKYIYTEWRVENLSEQTVSFEVNSALTDSEGNVAGKTGVMYGLGDTVELEAYQYTDMQDWYSSTELQEKFLIWGRDFNKRTDPLWFKALQLSDKKVKIPDYAIQTDDISSNENEEAVVEE